MYILSLVLYTFVVSEDKYKQQWEELVWCFQLLNVEFHENVLFKAQLSKCYNIFQDKKIEYIYNNHQQLFWYMFLSITGQ